jgi:hypothetical protein
MTSSIWRLALIKKIQRAEQKSAHLRNSDRRDLKAVSSFGVHLRAFVCPFRQQTDRAFHEAGGP